MTNRDDILWRNVMPGADELLKEITRRGERNPNTLCWTDDANGPDRDYQLTFGWAPDGEPVGNLCWEEGQYTEVIPMPLEVLLIAVTQGFPLRKDDS